MLTSKSKQTRVTMARQQDKRIRQQTTMRGRQSWGPLWKVRPGMTRTMPGSSNYSGRLTFSNPYSGACATYLVFSGFLG